jgi:ribosomal protein S18 acetylase RimI-like enzyme
MNDSALLIRPATKKDLPQIARFAAALVRFHHSLDATRFFLTPRLEEGYEWFLGTEMERKESIIFVAERRGDVENENEIVGYAWGRLEPRDWMELRDACGRLHEIYVDPSARKLGAGKRLMAETLQWLERRGAPRVILTSAWQNKDAHIFFESLGFRYTMVEMTRESEV